MEEYGFIFKDLFYIDYFKINVVLDVDIVEFCGLFKVCLN